MEMSRGRKSWASSLPMPRISLSSHLGVFILIAVTFLSVPGQARVPSEQETVTGTVVSLSRNTLVVRSEDGQYRLFTFDPNTTKPNSIPAGSEVRVTSSPTDDPSARVANVVEIVRAAPTGAPPPASNVPPSIRTTEREIEREVRKFQVGVRAGVGLNPELAIVGAQAQMGPIFSKNVFFRPDFEFEWGQKTKVFAIDPDLIYRLPLASATAHWSMYFGIGAGLNFLTQRATGYNFSAGLNILAGVRNRNGVFTEIRSSVYAAPAPVIKVIVGYSF
jgi:hypothetical protein